MSNNTEIGKRLRECAERKYGKRGMSAYAKEVGISPALFNDYLQGRRNPGNKMQERLRELGEDVEYIMTGEKKPIMESNIVLAKGAFFKVIISVNAGDPEHIFREENYTGEEIFFPFPYKDRAFVVKVAGDSMSCIGEKSIESGSYILVDMDASILNGDVVVVNLHSGRQMVKQFIQGEKDSVIFRSYNAQHPDIIVKQTEIITMFRAISVVTQKRI